MASDSTLLKEARNRMNEILDLQQRGQNALQQEPRQKINSLWFVAEGMRSEARELLLQLGGATNPGRGFGYLKLVPEVLQIARKLALWAARDDFPAFQKKAHDILAIARRLQELLKPHVRTAPISCEPPPSGYGFIELFPAENAADSEPSESNGFTLPTQASSDPRGSLVSTDIADTPELPVVRRQELERQLEELGVHYQHQDHEAIASTLYQLACGCSKAGDLLSAEEHLQKAWEMFRRLGNSNHPLIFETRREMGSLCRTTGDRLKAEQLLNEALEEERAFRGHSNHPSIAATLHELGDLRRVKGDLCQAEQLLYEALEMKRSVYDKDHANTAVTLHALGCLFRERKNLPKAEELLQEALKMKRAVYGDTAHTNIAATLVGLGKVRRLLGDLPRANEYLEDALTMLREVHSDSNHPNIVATLYEFRDICREAGNHSRAEELHQEALSLSFQQRGQ
ncbi:unnamed protein product [Effrenium voratum]|uniref:Kinesin light chain n=1 Tax=Effrenium voratum TaxID=2562239 RepID=A0AA36IBQ0_9DINO|nr:unnamed protein product [Effrenium voratum]CAJ1450067.1 unnamed protein product [Effrenium voratum]